jgi:hypothetical protein
MYHDAINVIPSAMTMRTILVELAEAGANPKVLGVLPISQ